MNSDLYFVVALYGEAETFLSQVNNLTETKIADKRLFEGDFCGRKIHLAISGIGKVSASLTTQAMIDKFHPEMIINFGTCGGLQDKVETLSYYIVDKGCQFDFDITEIDNVPVGYIQEYKRVFFDGYYLDLGLKKMNLATADRFSNKKEDIDKIISMGCVLRDMEGTAIMQVCTSNNVKPLLIKGVTDVYGKPTSDYFTNSKIVKCGFPNIIKNIIEK